MSDAGLKAIRVRPATRDVLREAKRPEETWDAFLVRLASRELAEVLGDRDALARAALRGERPR